MQVIVEGVCANIENYTFSRKAVGKLGVQSLTGPKAMWKIVYPMLHMYLHLLVDGVGKLGIDLYDILTHKEFVIQNDKSVGSGIPHYSKWTSPLVLDSEDKTVNKLPRKRPRGWAGSVLA